MTKLPCSFFLLVLLVLSLFLSGCDKNAPVPTAAVPAPKDLLKLPFQDPITPQLFELPSGALTVWRQFGKYQPALVLFTAHPFLDSIPQEQMEIVKKFIQDASDAEIIRRGQVDTADSIFLSSEVTSIAINEHFISEIILVLPKKPKTAGISLELFRAQALESTFLTQKESAALILENGVISGVVRGVPLRVVTLDTLPKLSTPVVIHLDLGFFKDSYTDEIKTPVYDLLYQTANSLQTAAYPTLAFTLSFSNREFNYSLESRFMVRDFAETVENPDFLHIKSPPTWNLRSTALFSRVMFLETRAKELIAQAAQITPPDPAALYAQALELLAGHNAEKGFSLLDQAVRLDKEYGLAYKELALKGMEIGNVSKAIDLQTKACALFPENPFLRLQLANMLILDNRGKEALPLLEELSQQPWAPGYGGIPLQIEQLKKTAELQPDSPKISTPSGQPVKTPTTKRPKFNHMGMGIPGQ